MGIEISVNFVWEGNRQIWLGVTHVGDSPFNRREHYLGYIELEQVMVNSDKPVDARIVCGWPPLQQFFQGMSEFLLNRRIARNPIYQRGLEQEMHTLNRILLAVNRMEGRQSELANTLESLRRWAKAIQQSGLPIDPDLKASIESIAQDMQTSGGVSQYLEINLPLVPGIINYKAEIGSEHKAELVELWNELRGKK